MKRNVFWWLLVGQILPMLLLAAEFLAEYLLPIHSIREVPGSLLGVFRFVVDYWLLVCFGLMFLGVLIAIIVVSFDHRYTKWQRFAWAVCFLLGQWLVVTLYCTLSLLDVSTKTQRAAA